MRRCIALVSVLAACGAQGAEPPPPPVAPSAGLITDEECIARGGTVVTEQTYADLDRRRREEPPTPFRRCDIPAPENGAPCADEAACGRGRCWCTGALARPNPQDDPALLLLDGAPGMGRCNDRPVESGSWFCLVGGGVIHLRGIIVD